MDTVKNKTTENMNNKDINKEKTHISIIRVIVGGSIGVCVLVLVWLFVYYTGIFDASPSGFEVQMRGSGMEIVSYTGEEKNLTIPSTINGHNVVYIGEKAFYKNESVEKLVLPSTIKEVGKQAFAETKVLKEVEFKSEYTQFGEGAFKNSSIVKAKLPTRLQKISNGMFKNCKNVTSISFPDDLKSIGDEAFWGCTSLEGMTIGDDIFKIGKDAFANERTGFTLSSIIGSETENYARDNGIEYVPCNSYYEVYTKYNLSYGKNTFNTRQVSEGRKGILSFFPSVTGYYQITLEGKGVNFFITDAIEDNQVCSSIKGDDSDFIGYYQQGKEYYFPVRSDGEANYVINVQRVDKGIATMYQKGENLLKGNGKCKLAGGSYLYSNHNTHSENVAQVNSDIVLTKVLDYYIEDSKHIWYQINANVGGSGKQDLWFRSK
ncbi:MAG: leucine-rich repeat domain-containing protein [Ruminococcus sp.]